MLKNKTLTYISLFSCAGVGCFGFKKAGFECIATNELIERRINVQKFNDKCKFDSGYICDDITTEETKNKIFAEIKKWEKMGNDKVDVLIATPPCQGMSVANHKKAENEIIRNSLVVESVHLVQKINPRFFIFENVAAFMKTGCTAPDGSVKAIGDVIYEELGEKYIIASRILNFKNYGSNSSRTRTVVIGVNREMAEYVSPIELYPAYVEEKSLRSIIGNMPELEWGEICSSDFYHAFRTYPERMRCWIHDLKEGECAFDNQDELKRPHKIVDGKIVPNIQKNGDKYTRQYWDKVAPCIHTRNGKEIIDIPGYDSYIKKDTVENLSAYKFVGNQNVYLTPNMTYKPRVMRNTGNVVVNGSVAVLIPKEKMALSERQMEYFSSAEYRKFYQIARNYQTRSLNVDATSVFFYGVLKECCNG